MTSPLLAVLLALALFQIKHFLCDFVFQTQNQVRAKAIYGHLGGLGHAGLHAVLSVPALLVLTRSLPAIAAVMFVEFVVHYHVDWAKARLDSSQGWTIEDARYWIAFGTDQFIHQMTYLAFVYVLAT